MLLTNTFPMQQTHQCPIPIPSENLVTLPDLQQPCSKLSYPGPGRNIPPNLIQTRSHTYSTFRTPFIIGTSDSDVSWRIFLELEQNTEGFIPCTFEHPQRGTLLIFEVDCRIV